MIAEALKLVQKHLAGKHPQKSHAGGKGGGSGKSPIENIRDKVIKGEIAGSFNETEERAALIAFDGKPKEGVTRVQMKRFFDRRNAVKAAGSDIRRGGISVKKDLDTVISEGMIELKKKNAGWYVLSTPTRSTTLNLKRPSEINYLLTVFNEGDFKKLY